MSDQPVDDHSEEFEQLAGLSALRVLEGEELATFEQHAEHCQRCRLMVRLDRQALAAVALLAPPMDPSPDFKRRLMQRAAAELAAAAPDASSPSPAPAPGPPTPALEPPPPALEPHQPAPEQPPPAQPDRHFTISTPAPAADTRPRPTPLRGQSNVVAFWRRTPWASALAAVVVLGLVSFGAYSYENQPVATYQLSGNAPGSASVVIRRSGSSELEMTGVPDPGQGYVYEAWIIPSGKDPVAAGITTTGNATLPLPGDVRGTTVAITREQGRVDAPTSAPLMATVVQS